MIIIKILINYKLYFKHWEKITLYQKKIIILSKIGGTLQFPFKIKIYKK